MMNCYLKFSHTISSFYSSFSFKHDLYVIPTMIYMNYDYNHYKMFITSHVIDEPNTC